MAKPKPNKRDKPNKGTKSPSSSGIPSLSARRHRLSVDLATDELDNLHAVFDRLLSSAQKDVKRLDTGLDGEMFGSDILGLWYGRYLVDADVDEVMGGGLISYLVERNSRVSTTLLCAVGAVAPESLRDQANQAIAEVQARGITMPPWLDQIGPHARSAQSHSVSRCTTTALPSTSNSITRPCPAR